MEGTIEVMEIRRRKRRRLLDDLKKTREYCTLKEEDQSRSHSVQNSLWKRLWTCRKTDCRKKARM